MVQRTPTWTQAAASADESAPPEQATRTLSPEGKPQATACSTLSARFPTSPVYLPSGRDLVGGLANAVLRTQFYPAKGGIESAAGNIQERRQKRAVTRLRPRP